MSAPACGCGVELQWDEGGHPTVTKSTIVYCLTHAAAFEWRAALARITGAVQAYDSAIADARALHAKIGATT